MNPFFEYDVDAESRRACLGIIARAAERVARGGQAWLGEEKTNLRGRRKARARSVSSQFSNQIFALRQQGKSLQQIAAELKTTLNRVKYVLYVSKGKRG